MIIEKENIEQIKNYIENSKKILIIAHKNPDWDTLWCWTAWFEYLKNIWKSVVIACESDIPNPLKCIPNYEYVVNDFNLNDFDLAIINDAWAKQVAWFYEKYPELFEQKIPVINIDHHISNDMYWSLNIVIPLAATACLIYEIFKELWVNINPKIATSLLTWIYTDTWSFHHSNTDSYTLRIASKLLWRWANIKKISKEIFKTTKISTLKLWWRVLSGISKDSEWIAMWTVTEEDFKETWSKFEELTWVVDYLNSVPNSKYTILLTEKDWKVKWSLRTLNNDIDLTKIAWRFWGWWHKKASWFTINWKLQKEVKWKVVENK